MVPGLHSQTAYVMKNGVFLKDKHLIKALPESKKYLSQLYCVAIKYLFVLLFPSIVHVLEKISQKHFWLNFFLAHSVYHNSTTAILSVANCVVPRSALAPTLQP